jgi:hypothetical protein
MATLELGFEVIRVTLVRVDGELFVRAVAAIKNGDGTYVFEQTFDVPAGDVALDG